jgi:hypothetical protein
MRLEYCAEDCNIDVRQGESKENRAEEWEKVQRLVYPGDPACRQKEKEEEELSNTLNR